MRSADADDSTRQLRGSASAWVTAPSASTGAIATAWSPSMSVRSKPIVKSHHRISKVALPLTLSGNGPSSAPATDT